VAAQTWAIEAYQRGLKQCCGVERGQGRKAVAQRTPMLFAVRAFVRVEVHRLATGVRWYAAKTAIVRDAITAYLAHLTLRLLRTA
jgi:putative transposase